MDSTFYISPHEKKLRNFHDELSFFHTTMKQLGEKLNCLLVQLPPSFNYGQDYDSLVELMYEGMDTDKFRNAVEFRNSSWFREDIYHMLSNKKVSLVWSVNQYTRDFPSEVTADFLYLRLIGDRELTKFHRIQKDRTQVMEESWRRLGRVLDSVNEVLVFPNNHFEGFAPGTMNRFRKIAGLEELSWRWTPRVLTRYQAGPFSSGSLPL